MGSDGDMEKDSGRLPGLLTQISLNSNEEDLLIEYLDNQYPSLNASLLYRMVGKENMLMFLDVMEGLTIRVPQRQVMARILSQMKIYYYIKSHNFTEESYESASKLFKKRVMLLKQIVERVEEALDKDDTVGWKGAEDSSGGED